MCVGFTHRSLSLLLLLAVASAQLNPPPACRATLSAPPGCVVGGPCIVNPSPASAGGCCRNSDASKTCTTCPNCCRVANPVFSKQCALNAVLILDNSGSLESYCNDNNGVPGVRSAIKNFVSGMQNVANVGGSVYLGVLRFSFTADVVFAMARVTPTYVDSINSWVDGNDVGSIGGYCKNMQGTNWGASLLLADQTTWNPAPDIWIWFTDGHPEYAGGYYPNTQCEQQCFSRSSSFFSDICNPTSSYTHCTGTGLGGVADDDREELWTACSAADKLKAQGKKLFLIGVGGVGNGHENEVQLVTGKIAWDGAPSTFGNADYYLQPDYAKLQEVFVQVVAGLCSCLQAQPECAARGNSCNSKQFTARVRITTTASSVSSTIPKSVVVHANILYNYLPSPNTRIAYQFYQNGQTVADASPTLVRTDLQNPCLVQRAVQCTSGCVQISETLLIPRFFAESTDVDSTGGSTCATSQYSGRASLAGCTCYEKRYASPPYGAQVPEMIKYIWVVNSGNFEPCAAEAFDGTFYEFFRSSALTVGVNAVGVAPSMPTMTSCTSSVCSTPLELGILIDEQSTCTADDYTRINYFVYQIITSFPINPSSRFGIAYTQSVNDVGQFTNLVSTDASAWRALLGCPNPPCPSPVGVAHVRKGSVGANIYTAVTNAMNKWWPTTPSTGVKREVLTIVCGGTTGTAGERATMTSTFTNLGVERWAIGVGAGASSTTLLADLASQNQYYHYIAVASSLVLGNQLQLQSQLLCPQESLCGSNCRGICTCTSPTNRVCQCPTCATSFCLPATCVSPSAGCIATPNACSDNNLCTNDKCNVATQACENTAVSCPPGNSCQTSGCNPATGCTLLDKTCDDSNACTANSCDTSTGCKFTAITCDDNNKCTSDSCSTATGCVFTPVSCDDSNKCTTDSCSPATGCANTAVTCDDNDPCTTNSCNPGSGCVFTPIVCNDNNPCTTDQCVGGSCVFTPVTCDDSNPCTTDTCSGGKCVFNPIVCNDNNVCTTDTCSGGKCVFTDNSAKCDDNNKCTTDSCAPLTGCVNTAITCNDNSLCTTDTCNPATGCVFTAITCSDSNLCTTDSCVPATGCSFTPVVCASDNNACTEDKCNTADGKCVYPSIPGCSLCATATNCQGGTAPTPNMCQARRCIESLPSDSVAAVAACNAITNYASGYSASACVTRVSNVAGAAYCFLTEEGANRCPTTVCDPKTCNTVTGACDGTPLVCDDGKACTTDTCSNAVVGGCVFTAVDCSSLVNPCQAAACDTATGSCKTTPTNCDDSNPCTVDTCNSAVGGGCVHTPINCAAQNTPCTTFACVAGQCVGTPKTCVDGDLCTVDSCSDSVPTGCVFTPVDCTSLVNPCQNAKCDSGTGSCKTTPVTCDDGKLCTTDTCNPAVGGGCVFTPISCTSLDTPCATYSCSATTGQCTPTPVTCDDGKKCTTDKCVASGPGPTGCVYTPVPCPTSSCNTYACDSGTGACVATPINCADADGCTNDTCVEGVGCVHTPIVCEQLVTCFVTECQALSASSYACVPTNTSALQCNDNSLCTTDECKQGIGCVYTNKTCNATTECDFPDGCDPATGNCILRNITSLFDFCGVCLGDNIGCFFSSVLPVSSVAGLAAGIVAAIVIAAIIALVVCFFLSRKGYQYWKSKGDLSSTGAHHNPYFRDNNNAGVMPE